MIRQLDQFVRGNPGFLVGVMRMGADRAIDVWKSLRDCQQPANAPHPRRDGHDAPNACGRSPRHDGVKVVGEIRKIEMAVAVDKYRSSNRSGSGRFDIARKYSGWRGQ